MRRRRILVATLSTFLILTGLVIWGLHQPAVRISNIEVFGTELPIDELAKNTMSGSYLGIIPRDSVFFFPKKELRTRIRGTYSDIAALSIFRTGLQTISLRVAKRVPIARWCPENALSAVGTSTIDTFVLEECYLFDDSGVLFATSSDVAIVNPFIFHSPLEQGDVLGQVVPHASELPTAFDFARQISSPGSQVTSLTLTEQEVTLNLSNGTKVIYTLGTEEAAFTTLTSAKDSIKLSDGSIDYVDLRFGSKVYLKRKSDSVAE